KRTDAERKADDGPSRLVHLSVSNGESALPESTGPTGKRSARKRACSVWSGGKAAKPYLSLPYGELQRVALQQDASYRVKGALTDGFDSTTKSLRTLFPGARLGVCLRHALLKLPKKLTAIASPVRKTLRSQFHTLLYRARQRKSLRVFALGQRLRR